MIKIMLNNIKWLIKTLYQIIDQNSKTMKLKEDIEWLLDEIYDDLRKHIDDLDYVLKAVIETQDLWKGRKILAIRKLKNMKESFRKND